jgi:hypothetical protein
MLPTIDYATSSRERPTPTDRAVALIYGVVIFFLVWLLSAAATRMIGAEEPRFGLFGEMIVGIAIATPGMAAGILLYRQVIKKRCRRRRLSK